MDPQHEKRSAVESQPPEAIQETVQTVSLGCGITHLIGRDVDGREFTIGTILFVREMNKHIVTIKNMKIELDLEETEPGSLPPVSIDDGHQVECVNRMTQSSDVDEVDVVCDDSQHQIPLELIEKESVQEKPGSFDYHQPKNPTTPGKVSSSFSSTTASSSHSSPLPAPISSSTSHQQVQIFDAAPFVASSQPTELTQITDIKHPKCQPQPRIPSKTILMDDGADFGELAGNLEPCRQIQNINKLRQKKKLKPKGESRIRRNQVLVRTKRFGSTQISARGKRRKIKKIKKKLSSGQEKAVRSEHETEEDSDESDFYGLDTSVLVSHHPPPPIRIEQQGVYAEYPTPPPMSHSIQQISTAVDPDLQDFQVVPQSGDDDND